MISQPPPLVVGILGGIGSGKSEVATALARRSGGRVINADLLGHEALRDPALREALVDHFGGVILDAHGEIDRKRLAAVVFRDKADLLYLELLTHPWIRGRMEEEVRRCHAEAVPLIAIDASLLLEAGWTDVCHKRVFVDAPLEVRLQRVMSKRGWTAEDLQTRQSAQLPLTRKHSQADHIIENSTTQESLGKQVDDLLHRWGMPREPSLDPISGANPILKETFNKV